MNWFFLSFLTLFILTGSCTSGKKEENLRKREAALDQKEQQLLLKEKSLQLKEEELSKREQHANSTSHVDSTHLIDLSLTGNWSVKMVCTETTCAGSAVGDTKSETWQLSYESNSIIVKAMANNQLVRVYTGFFTGNTIELVGDNKGNSPSEPTRMIVRLRVIDKMHLEGQREITREDCKVIYTLQLEKESPTR
jgi:hypothetical protein